MQTGCWTSSVVLMLGASLFAQPAAAGPQEDVAAAGQKWATVFADNNPDTIVALYAKDGVLWGTLSPSVRSDPASVKAYFVGAFQALPKAISKDEGGEKAPDSPSGYSRGEGQKPVSKAYRDNWNAIYAKKKKR